LLLQLELHKFRSGVRPRFGKNFDKPPVNLVSIALSEKVILAFFGHSEYHKGDLFPAKKDGMKK
jgi:hypothetical protein